MLPSIWRGWSRSASLTKCTSSFNTTPHRTILTDMVRVVEVGPRDGLQNLPQVLPASTKIELINRLSHTGLRSIEATSFVSPKWVPQMADSASVLQGIDQHQGVDYPVLVPNLRGLNSALELGAQEVVLFVSASEGFSHANVNCSVEDSLKRCRDVASSCSQRRKDVKIRGVISCVVGCPYDGQVEPKHVSKVAEELLTMGCYEVALGDTIGVGTPASFGKLLDELRAMTGGDIWRFAAHCHDTYGQALANVYECLRQGVRVFDSSVAGLGGCPYAPGASGNLATEDLLYLLHGEGMQTGVDLEKVVEVGAYICEQIPTENRSKVAKAMLAKRGSRSSASKVCGGAT
ncbi:hypothetical protein QAD02_016944 [Eretmocerus hayati]|uniref:Uncharacterized protein n=1 Tax=Eretmocerus hayati TaxID=131215 RepID=A0ACC2PCW1_9HYME|nr:hypothetical protein QAD02_016944 [Eretmocerus hayati]